MRKSNTSGPKRLNVFRRGSEGLCFWTDDDSGDAKMNLFHTREQIERAIRRLAALHAMPTPGMTRDGLRRTARSSARR